MVELDKAVRLRERAGVSYEEAREALDSSGGDMLDALIWLEKNGKVPPPDIPRYTTAGGTRADAFTDAPDSHKGYKYTNREREQGRYWDKDSDAHKRRSGKKHRGQAYYYDESDVRSRASHAAGTFFGFLGKAFQIGNSTMFEISRYGRDVIKIPLTILVIAFFLFFQVIIVLIPVGLFFGLRYRLTGNMFDEGVLNKVMNTAADAADGIKNAFKKHKS